MRRYSHQSNRANGFVLVFTLIIVMILILVGFSLVRIAEGDAVQNVLYQNEQVAMAAAEAAYEKAVFWMSDNPDLLMDMDVSGTTGSLTLPNAHADYDVSFYGFVGYRPVFEVTADGYCGTFHRSIRVYVAQAVSGWEMGMCRVPSGPRSTGPVYFVDGETVDMPIHINSNEPIDDSERDIFISGEPIFLSPVSMEESRYSRRGSDKYRDVLDVFGEGISFEQPRSLISDEASVTRKINWYADTIGSQRPDLIFRPQKNNRIRDGIPAVQVEFFVNAAGIGCVRITDNCTIRGYIASGETLDYKIQPGSDGKRFEKYPVYGYHYIPQDAAQRRVHTIESLQIVTDYGGHQAPPCGMLYVDGNVIIGSASEYADAPQIGGLNTVQGKVAVIATGNIYLTNSTTVSNQDDQGTWYPRDDDGMPALDNPNALALFAGGVIKVVDPGLVEDLDGRREPRHVTGMLYEPVGLKDHRRPAYPDYTYHRHLPDPMVVEAAITVGGGGWGAEHVQPSVFSREERKEESGRQDDLILRGTLSEAVRGVVGLTGYDGYLKQYYFDRRMLSGLIPGTVRLKGKFIPVPGGWSDFRIDTKTDD